MSERHALWKWVRRTAARAAGWWHHPLLLSLSDSQPLLRAELFSVDQMEQHGATLAGTHALISSGRHDRLLKRLAENQQVLTATCSLLTQTVQERQPIAPAGEWLLDNFYLIEEQIRTARQHLPRGYSRELPCLSAGPSAGLPRVYDLALEVISHGDGRWDAITLSRFVTAYQQVSPLALGELWAIPIMLRLALIENLRRLGIRINSARLHVNQARQWATEMMQMAESDPKNLILVIADMARSNPPMVSPFVAELSRRLQGHGSALALPLTWIEQRLAESNQTIAQMVLTENQQQAADQVSISNSIGSLRVLSAVDWRVFVESMSVVESILLQDPAASYAQMDFTTRDQYRHVIDRLAKRSLLSEADIAHHAIRLAQAVAGGKTPQSHAAHVGYFLIDRGLPQLERALQLRDGLLRQVVGAVCRVPLLLHLGCLLLITGALTAALLWQSHAAGVPLAQMMLLAVLSPFALSPLGAAVAHWLAALLVQPKRLPRMDYSKAIPMAMQSLVVIPTLLECGDDIDALLESIEVRFLGNRDAALYFGLLTDFSDADAEVLETDADLLERVRRGVDNLNIKYRNGDPDRFFLFHRPRQWNPGERRWMGYERKRGKLSDLNVALRGQRQERFSSMVGEFKTLAAVRYVITLDSDTHLPRDAARQMIGAMAHPLNRPRFDPAVGRVRGGYGILQPCMASSLTGANQSRYAQLCGSEPGIDPYTCSASDVYQDLYGEGSFIGKGIYDIDAFERSLDGCFPDNRILSHDLLEGCYARSGLLSDVHLYESYPARYATDVQRQRRWIRGDWQVAQWFLPKVPGADGRARHNLLSALSRWKIFDNLRRSLAHSAQAGVLLLGWFVLPDPLLWTLAVVMVVLLPALLNGFTDVFRKPPEVVLGQHLISVLSSAIRNLTLAGFRLACLPYEVSYSLGAILRTLWRMGVTHRGLLEWSVTSGVIRDQQTTQANREPSTRIRDDLAATYRRMIVSPMVVGIVVVGLILMRPEALLVASLILLLWIAAPAMACWLSLPLQYREVTLPADQMMFLRKIARRTWAFFEDFVGATDHALPPDNHQESPGPVTAHRTSPTNIGLALLANLSAHDFGYLPLGGLLRRTEKTFEAMQSMERYQGHFYNWYDTLTLKPLPPRYVSTVDSGNLVGHLLTLRAGLLSLPDQSVVAPRLFEGLIDVFSLLDDATQSTPAESYHPLIFALAGLLQKEKTAQVQTWCDFASYLQEIVAHADPLCVHLGEHNNEELKVWAQALLKQSREALDDMLFLVPWTRTSSKDRGMTEFAEFSGMPSLRELAVYAGANLTVLLQRIETESDAARKQELLGQHANVLLCSERVQQQLDRIVQLSQEADRLATVSYAFLYDRARCLLAVGYNVDELRRDNSCYDLLASEARLSSFVGIAQGGIPQENWFALGRLLSAAGDVPILMSWSGSMFEYLMPLLVMPVYPGTLLDQTCREVVAQQIVYGQQRGLPWGVSESGYNTVDASLNYQYHAFGVPGLGLKRGLADDSVIAPYASALALMVDPEAACANLQRLATEGLVGRYGFYEAIDYTASRLARGQTGVIVRSFMAHHLGMSLLSLQHVILGRQMQQRFSSDPALMATLLLLQERIPKVSVANTRVAENSTAGALFDLPQASPYAPMSFETAVPEVQLLSNGRYHVMVSNAGGGYSRWKDMAVTRWREDATRDHWGTYIYLRDVDNGEVWSATHQPTLKMAQHQEAVFTEGRAEYRRRDFDIEAHTDLVVSPEDDIELRRLQLTNRSRRNRTIEITTYAEVVLAPQMADLLQPGFGNLFVQTEILPALNAILCTRRPRSTGEKTLWMFHLLASQADLVGPVSFETDRMVFVGRGRSLASPAALLEGVELSGSEGSVLDPITSTRCRLSLEAGESAMVDLVWGVAESRADCMALIERYQDRHLADRVFDLAWTHGGVTLRQINASESDAQLYRRLAGSVIYAHAAMRAENHLLMQNRRGQSGLWGYAISGDWPIVLLKISDDSHLQLARQMIQCHAYWRLKGLVVDLVIWNEDPVGYRQLLHEQIHALIAKGIESHAIDRPGGIFVRSVEQISKEDRVLLLTVARAIIAGNRGLLIEQIGRRQLNERKVAPLLPSRSHRTEPAIAGEAPRPQLILRNPIGGFSADGTEYVVTTTQGQQTPLPWVNVIANPHFGTVVAESGLAYTWSENAHEFRLSPWSNDPVSASPGEALYLRDEETGHYWSPCPQPYSGAMPYVTRHGFGYSVFEHTAGGIRSELWVYVDREEAIKFSVLKIRNGSGRRRRLSATHYVEWVLGDLRAKTAMQVVTEIDGATGALFARNAYHSEFSDRVAFMDVDDLSRTVTGDRTEFIGRNGQLSRPSALGRAHLSGRVGAALDPCGAIQVPFDLSDGQERKIIFRLGAGKNLDDARQRVQRYRKTGAAQTALEEVRQYWNLTLGTLQIRTPDPALDVLANGWLMYQTLSCRLWARSGFYQSGGAFGFRDQLQDVMALVHAEPKLARDHLLRSAARQFVTGDVQHWWHPPSGQGVRTRCSDDYLWLPYAVAHYIERTGDTGVLDESVSFIEGRPLAPEEESFFGVANHSSEQASLYEHCLRALRQGLHVGVHGLPLMGSGDWNDGMNLVGIEGRGESVWLGFFLHEVLQKFSHVAEVRGDLETTRLCHDKAGQLRLDLEHHAWDGEWYRRAYFDDGTPLGSAQNEECQIDSITQSWSVLSGAVDSARARIAMNSLDRHLISREHGLVRLLNPPFDTSAVDPGYIKGYVPGVRENGGQYTHAAIWAAMGYAKLGERERAWEVLDLINPVHHTQTAKKLAVYKGEPYVMAADVYAMPPHEGRAGWTWYTGSAGWMQRLIVESLLGLVRRGNRLHLSPCPPPHWDRYSLTYRHGASHYVIEVVQAPAQDADAGVVLTLDGTPQEGASLPLTDDGLEHRVQVTFTPRQALPSIKPIKPSVT